jgi:hypothetical protein
VKALHTGGEATAALLQDAADGGRSVMIPGAFDASFRVPIDRASLQSVNGANWSGVTDAISDVDRAEYELEGGGALSERQHPTGREEAGGSCTTGDRMRAWGRIGVFWGALWGALFGPEFFVMPGLRTLFGVGPMASWIVGALEGAVVLGSMSALVAGLLTLGMFKRTREHETTHRSHQTEGANRDR